MLRRRSTCNNFPSRPHGLFTKFTKTRVPNAAKPNQSSACVLYDGHCAHLYFCYWDHDFGLMHIRIQPWLPFTIQICLNGCEWLAQQLRRLDSRFEQHDNCVYAVANLALAQLNTQRWTRVLRAFAVRVNPLLRRYGLRPYYWSLEESEYATDVLFRDPACRRSTPHSSIMPIASSTRATFCASSATRTRPTPAR